MCQVLFDSNGLRLEKICFVIMKWMIKPALPV